MILPNCRVALVHSKLRDIFYADGGLPGEMP